MIGLIRALTRKLTRRVKARHALALARAYRKLIGSVAPYEPYRALNAIIDVPLELPRRRVQWLVGPVLSEKSEIYIVQVLINGIRAAVTQNLILTSVNQKKSRAYPIPKRCRNALAAQGVPVSGIASSIALARFQFGSWRTTFKLRRYLLVQARESWKNFDESSIVLGGTPYLSAKHKLQAGGFTYFDWLIAQKDLVNNDDRLLVITPEGSDIRFPDSRLRAVEYYFPRLGTSARKRFSLDSLLLLLKGVALSLTGQWWAPILTAGALEALYFENVDRPSRRYIFTIAGSALVRPLWTYLAEKRAIDSYLVYYATNIDPLPGPFPFELYPGMQLQSWSNYVAFNDKLAVRLLECAIGSPRIVVRGPIDYSDDPSVEISLPRRSILVLDTPIRRLLMMPAHGILDHFITPEFATAFFAGIAKAAAALDATVVWKGKRYGGGQRAVRYRRAIQSVAKYAPLIVLNETLSPRRLAAHCGVCVAAPFTSAALLFHAGGPSAGYYDALSALPRDLREFNGLPVLAEQKQLERWLQIALDQTDTVACREGSAPAVGYSNAPFQTRAI